MGKSLSYQARRQVLQQVSPQYREASSSQKRTLLDAFVARTEYHRSYAGWLLNHAEVVQQTHGRSQLHKYGPEVQHALFLAWHAANVSAPNGSSLFSLPYSRRWSGMSIYSLLRSAASNSFP